jgi:capsular exopolysaccharide synthesis family protein
MSDSSDSTRSASATSETAAKLALARRRLPAAEQEFSVRFLVGVVAQWWKWLVPTTLVLLVISLAAVFYLFQPQYRASAWLQVKSQQPFVAFPDDTPVDREATQKFVRTQIELLRSPLIIMRALSQPEIAQLPEIRRRRDPVEWLATEGLFVAAKGDSELLEVAYASPDPQAAAKVVDAIVNAYFTIRNEKADAQVQSVIMLLENEKTRRSEGIKLLQAEIRQLQAQLMAKDPSMVASTLSASDIVISENPLKHVQHDLSKAQIESRVLDAQITALESALQSPISVPDVLVDREVDQRPEVQVVIEQLNQKRAALDRIAAVAANAQNDIHYRRAEQEILQLEETLASLRNASRPRIRQEMEAMAGLEQRRQLETLRTQLSTQGLISDNLRTKYDAMVKDLSLSGSQTLDLRMKQRELDRRQEVHDRIADRAAQLATEMYAPQRVEPIQDATVPEVPLELLPWRPLLVAILSSLALPFGFCALWEKSVRRVTSVEQLQQQAALPVIGEIARLPHRQTRRPDAARSLDYELGVFEESVDSLRTGLVLSREYRPLRILAVSSAVSGEGKSSVASQLAVSLARSAGRAILLIDGDMRSPDLHRIFQIPLQPGLADVLAGGQAISECIHRGWSEHVHILPAGRLGRSPHKLVGSERFSQLLRWARKHYRYVVIDTPPILAASESMVMARAADATLICAMRDVSREDHVRLTYQRLLAVGARPIGTVLSGVPTRQYARRYGSYVYTRK